jgi:predicted transcriptional regulator
MKTMKQLADELGITPQYIGRLAKRLPEALQPVKQGRYKMISEDAEREIREMVTINQAGQFVEPREAGSSQVHESKRTLHETQVHELEEKLAEKDAIIADLVATNKNLSKTLADAQQAQIAAVAQLLQLTGPKNEKDKKSEKNFSEPVHEPVTKQKAGAGSRKSANDEPGSKTEEAPSDAAEHDKDTHQAGREPAVHETEVHEPEPSFMTRFKHLFGR